MGTSKEILKVQTVGFRADHNCILENISFNLQQGEVVSIVGPSGSGKSTLLVLLNRLVDPSEGIITYRGKNLHEYPVLNLRRMIGMVMQQPVLFPGTVKDNILYGPSLMGVTDRVDVKKYMNLGGLPLSYLERDAAQLSGGEKQRVAFARTLANEPDVLLLDEPTSALDPGSTEVIEKTIEVMKQEKGLSALWVTHSLEQARRVSDRMLVLVEGKIAFFGPSRDALDDPGNGLAGIFLKDRSLEGGVAVE